MPGERSAPPAFAPLQPHGGALDDVLADIETLAPTGGLVLSVPVAGDNGLALALAIPVAARLLRSAPRTPAGAVA